MIKQPEGSLTCSRVWKSINTGGKINPATIYQVLVGDQCQLMFEARNPGFFLLSVLTFSRQAQFVQ